MKVYHEPSMTHWSAAGQARDRRDPSVVAAAAGDVTASSGPIIATGHQPWLWHPGILAKDIAAVTAAQRLGGTAVHLSVEHDPLDVLSVTLPMKQDDRLGSVEVVLATPTPLVPTGWHEAFDPWGLLEAFDAACRRLGPALAVDPGPLREALLIGVQQTHDNLAEQISDLLQVLRRPHAPGILVMPSRRVAQLPGFSGLVQRLLAEAPVAIARYNEAVREHPEADLTALEVTAKRVELPLWLVDWNQPRRRVYADMADLRRPRLVDEHGISAQWFPSDDGPCLMPRAVMQSAAMRHLGCDLFIHGRGGDVYDRVTDQWWESWMGEPLSPRAMVSADVHLPLSATMAEPAEIERAKWYRHHVPHNVDRVLELQDELSSEKRTLLAAMDRDRDRARRRAAFDRLHAINAALATAHPQVLDDAEAALQRAEIGVANRRLATRRDWCFALYPPEVLGELVANVEAAAGEMGAAARG